MAPTKTETKPAAPFALAIEDGVAPVSTRGPGNPFDEIVAELAATLTDTVKQSPAKSFKAPEGDVPKLARQLGVAGQAAGITIRQKPEALGDGQIRVHFVAVPKITRKPADAPAPAPQTETAPVG